jgi:CubicO group peptidase (beta-lactamase class C family)
MATALRADVRSNDDLGPASRDPVRGPYSAAIDRLFSAWDRPATPGALVGVVKDGRPIHQQGYGAAVVEHGIPHTPTTRYRLASVTKHFLSVATLMLQDEGKLRLDDPIHRYLPELPDFGAVATIRQMLTMSSGIRDLGETLTLSGVGNTTTSTADGLFEFACRLKTLNYPPAQQVSYSNTNYRLVQIVIERLSGLALRDFFRQRILDPLGMTRTRLADGQTEVDPEMAGGYWLDKDGNFRGGVYGMHYSGSGGMVSCLADMLKWHQAFRDGGPFRRGLFGDLEQRATLGNGRRMDYALGLTLVPYRGERSLGHGGSLPGFKIQFMRFPDSDLGIVLLCNREDAVPYQLARDIAGIVLFDRLKPAAKPAAALDRLIGTYVDKATGYTLDLKVANGALRAGFLGADEKLEATGDGRFVTGGGHMVIELGPIPAGAERPKKIPGCIGGGLNVTWVPVAQRQPKGKALAEFEGRYRSPETGAEHAVLRRGGRLAIRLLLGPYPSPWLDMEAIMADTFRFESQHMQWTSRIAVRFARDTKGRVVGLSLSSNRSRNLTFRRVGRAR